MIAGLFLGPKSWASLVPFGLGRVKPKHFREMLRIAWENRDQLPFAWRILRKGVCDGCALGTVGLRDFTMRGIHLCTVRLNLLRLNTMGALDPERLRDVERVRGLNGRELRRLGRLPYPFLRRKGEKGFRRIGWDEALDLIAERIRSTTPDRIAFYLTSRGLTNEVYYVAQKVARFLGTNHIDNSARLCHSPSTVALKESIGVGASTCSYRDWIGTDLLVLVGSDVANNQPVTTKYMFLAKRKGTRIVMINPFDEPGLRSYWVPSVAESALFGTRLVDESFSLHTGGDIGFLNGVLKHLVERDWLNRDFIQEHTSGFVALENALGKQSWESLERSSGTTRAEMLRFAELYRQARTAIFVWSMGITQHRHGVDNVRAIANLVLARGMVGRAHCGLVPIRGHSGVQGGSEVGAVPNLFPGGLAVNATNAERIGRAWGFHVPSSKGLSAVSMISAAHEGKLDVLYLAGGNFLETLPDPEYCADALARVPMRVHQDIVLSSAMLVDPAEAVLLLPARTRYEQTGGGTETSTERYILFSPEIPGRRVGESRDEWRILGEVAARVRPSEAGRITFRDCREIREEIARMVPSYEGIEGLRGTGDAVQWGGRLLCEGGKFPTSDGRARFSAVGPPAAEVPDGFFVLSTRRGKQFNSMVQAERDPLTGAFREDVLVNPEDAERLGLRDGDRIIVRSKAGQMTGRLKCARIRRGNVQAHFPEANVLLPRGVVDEGCGIPDYNALVKIVPDQNPHP